MKLGREGGAKLPAQASSDMANAFQKGIESLAEKHGKNLADLQQQQAAAAAAAEKVPAAEHGSGGGEPAAKQAWEQAKVDYKSPSQRSITQATFDEVVEENVEDFEMELKEAIADACVQFMKQGVNLNNIIKTEAHFNLKNKDVSDHPVTIAMTKLKEAIVAKDSAPTAMGSICGTLTELLKTFETDDEAVPISNSNNAIGTLVTLLRTYTASPCVVPAMEALLKLVIDGHSLEQFNEFGLGPDVVLECVRRNQAALPEDTECPDDISVLVAGLKVIKSTAKHNGCKDQYFGRGVAAVLDSACDRYADRVEVVKQAALSFRSLVRGDGTIDSKAPTYLKDLVEKGWLERLVKLLVLHLGRKDQNADGASACAFAIESVAINEKACTEAQELGAISALLNALRKASYSQNVVFVRRAGALLGALARSDKNKELIAEGVATFAECMIKHAKEHTVQKSFLSAFTAICLRQPEIAEAIVGAKGHHLAVSAMRLHPTQPGVQRSACMLLRNLGSRSPSVRVEIAEVGAEKFLRLARANHANCEDVAYAALRDLGFAIEGMSTYKVERPMHGMFTDQ